jgi:radical SAM superfamily enzyme YgiQ (UPF0313 family)
MRIAFVVCPEYTSTIPHLGIAYMRSILEKKHYETKYFDFSAIKKLDKIFLTMLYAWINSFAKKTYMSTFYTFLPSVIAYFNDANKLNPFHKSLHSYLKSESKNMANEILTFEPNYVCFSIYNSTLFLSLTVAKEIKEKNPNIKIIFGGPFLCDERLRSLVEKFDFIIDYIVVGEGELVIDKLISGDNGYKQKVIQAEPITNLDNLPFPNFDGCDFEIYKNVMMKGRTWRGVALANEKIIPIIATRGCPFQCAFCDHHVVWKNYRKRSVDNVIEEIKQQSDKYNCKIFRLNDSLINSDVDWLEKFCTKLLDSGLKIYWYAHCRADKFNKKIAQLMYKCGCRYLKFGVESGSQRVLHLMNKRININNVKEAISAAYEAGIKVRASFIYAYPGESRHELNETIKFIEEITEKLYVLRVYSFIFMPGTPLEIKATSNNINLINFEVKEGIFKDVLSKLPEEWNHPEINNEEIEYRARLMKQVLENFKKKNNNYIPYMFSDIYKNRYDDKNLFLFDETIIKRTETIHDNWLNLITDNDVKIKLPIDFFAFLKKIKSSSFGEYTKNLIENHELTMEDATELIIALISCGILKEAEVVYEKNSNS